MSVTPVEKTVLGVRNYTKYEPVLVIECKRLPAPSADREKEYVIRAEPKKKSGGIQRFKLGLHAGQFDIAAMVGYVQKGTFQDRHYQINQWISKMAGHSTPDGCVWTAKERLNPIEEDMTNKTAKCSSVHKRSSNNEIVIHHLWIAMCS